MLLTKNVFRTIIHLKNVRHHSIKVAIVGSGPAGFYTAQKLLHNPNIKVDIFERLPVPFGLVRYGVAPDHADVKNVINSFTSVAANDRVDFYGNVSIGKDLEIDDLIDNYHAVVLSYGSSLDKYLGIEGEKSKNAISARNFVGWYNGLPDDRDLEVNLDCDTACIIGQGNVAIDCARILLKPKHLAQTDITRHAQERLARSSIRRIYIIGRRGPMQVSFTSKELRELIKMNEKYTRIEPQDVFRNMNVNLKELTRLDRTRRRLTEILLNASVNTQKDLTQTSHEEIECIFKFLSNPHKIIADPSTNQVKALELRKNQYDTIEEFMDRDAKPIETGELETIDCGLIIRSIGYKSVMIHKNLPFNQKQGSILNTEGRVHGYKNLYCSGWLATGAAGVIAATLHSSQQAAQSILYDIKDDKLPNLNLNRAGYNNINQLLRNKGVQVIHFNDWLRIDELERSLGEEVGKPREKFVNVDKMLDLAKQAEGKPK